MRRRVIQIILALLLIGTIIQTTTLIFPLEIKQANADTYPNYITILPNGSARALLGVLQKTKVNLMDSIKTYGIISQPLYFMYSKSAGLTLPISTSFLILGISPETACIRLRTVLHTQV